MFIKKRRIVAEEELPETVDTEMEETFDDEDAGEGEVNVDPEISEVLFEAQDVGEILAEVTGEDVDVYSDQDTGDVIINVGDEEYTITPDEDAEEVTSAKKPAARRPVKASTRRGAVRRPASKKSPVKANSRMVKKIPGRK